MTTKSFDSIVFAPSEVHGGVKSLYSVCEWLSEIGRSRIVPFYESKKLACWFEHSCEVYNYSYRPELLIYPEVYQPRIVGAKCHICFAVGRWAPVKPHADLTVCRSREVLDWVNGQLPDMPAVIILPSIRRAIFEYDGRPKRDVICYMTRTHKHPETARILRERYGDKVIEIFGNSEAEVAEILKSAKVFVWRGGESEGSPRPPKEALVAGCIVVGLESDLHERYHTDFGIRCSTLDELTEMSGEALKMEIPSADERSVVRDSNQEKLDWFTLLKHLDIHKDERGDRALTLFAANLRSAQADEALVVEQRNRIDSLVASTAASTAALAAERATQLAERGQLIESLSLQLADKDEKLAACSAQLADGDTAPQCLRSQLADKEQTLRELIAQDAGHKHTIETLSAQLAEKTAAIDRLNDTFGWRLLSFYGKIKYPYLLPIYRLLGLLSRKLKLSH